MLVVVVLLGIVSARSDGVDELFELELFEFIPDSYLTVLSLMSLGILKLSLAMTWLVCQAYCGEAYIYFRIISNDGKAISYSGVHLQGDFFSLVPP